MISAATALPATSAAGMTQVAMVSESMAKNDGTYFKLLSANVVTLSECGRCQAFVTVGPKPSTLTMAASTAAWSADATKDKI